MMIHGTAVSLSLRPAEDLKQARATPIRNLETPQLKPNIHVHVALVNGENENVILEWVLFIIELYI